MHNPVIRDSSCARRTRVRRLTLLCACVLACSAGAIAAKEFVMPTAQAARTYPAHDDHSTEKIAVAVDPYDVEDKASIFTVNYRNYGYMPVFFVITNDGDQPVSLVGMKAQLNTKDRSKLYPASMDDLLRRLSHPSRNDRQITLPIPLPKKEVKGGVNRKTWDEIEQLPGFARALLAQVDDGQQDLGERFEVMPLPHDQFQVLDALLLAALHVVEPHEPADEERQATYHVLRYSGGDVCVHARGIQLQKLLRVTVGPLGGRQAGDLVLLHKGHVVGGHALDDGHRK